MIVNGARNGSLSARRNISTETFSPTSGEEDPGGRLKAVDPRRIGSEQLLPPSCSESVALLESSTASLGFPPSLAPSIHPSPRFIGHRPLRLTDSTRRAALEQPSPTAAVSSRPDPLNLSNKFNVRCNVVVCPGPEKQASASFQVVRVCGIERVKMVHDRRATSARNW